MNSFFKNKNKLFIVSFLFISLIVLFIFHFYFQKEVVDKEVASVREFYYCPDKKKYEAFKHENRIPREHHTLIFIFKELHSIRNETYIKTDIDVVLNCSDLVSKKLDISLTNSNDIFIKFEFFQPTTEPILEEIECTKETLPYNVSTFNLLRLQAKEGKHFYYPLDDLEFNTPIRIDPKIEIKEVQIINRTKGFYLEKTNNEKDMVQITDDGISLTFSLIRLGPIKLISYIVASFLVLYSIVVIFFINDFIALSSSIGGFFFSVWSIRSYLGGFALSYPTLLDFFIFYVSVHSCPKTGLE